MAKCCSSESRLQPLSKLGHLADEIVETLQMSSARISSDYEIWVSHVNMGWTLYRSLHRSFMVARSVMSRITGESFLLVDDCVSSDGNADRPVPEKKDPITHLHVHSNHSNRPHGKTNFPRYSTRSSRPVSRMGRDWRMNCLIIHILRLDHWVRLS